MAPSVFKHSTLTQGIRAPDPSDGRDTAHGGGMSGTRRLGRRCVCASERIQHCSSTATRLLSAAGLGGVNLTGRGRQVCQAIHEPGCVGGRTFRARSKHLSPKLEQVDLKLGEIIYQADQRIDRTRWRSASPAGC
jgi:hypothetical protein